MNNPVKIHESILEALKSIPSRNLSTNTAWRSLYADTRAALEKIGVKPTDHQIQHIYWSERIKTVWDQSEYITERHFGRLGFKVIWPRKRDETIRIIKK
jgi:hypothetical protein